jgi:hypothetical protein
LSGTDDSLHEGFIMVQDQIQYSNLIPAIVALKRTTGGSGMDLAAL